MQLTLPDSGFPILLHLDEPISDHDLMFMSEQSSPLRIERESNGDLTVITPGGTAGGGFEAEVLTELALWARLNGTGKCFGPSAGFALADNSVRAAEAHWLSFTQWRSLSRAQQEGYAPVCPEFIMEVRSKSDRLNTLRKKMNMWLANGAQLAWLIDPEEKTVEVYRPNEAPELHHNPTSVQGTGPVQGFELILTHIWP